MLRREYIIISFSTITIAYKQRKWGIVHNIRVYNEKNKAYDISVSL
jgi:hypothetical protein